MTIATFLLWSMDSAFRALWPAFSRAIEYVFTALAILDIPYFYARLSVTEHFTLLEMLMYFYLSLVSLLAAWVVSRWVYGVGPLRALSQYKTVVLWRNHA